MIEKICVFLRGINVNGINIKMESLRSAFKDMGFNYVVTILATGNVIINNDEDTRDKRSLIEYIENDLSKYFNYDAHIYIKNFDEIEDIIISSRKIEIPSEYHCYYLIVDNNAKLEELHLLFESIPNTSGEQFIMHNNGAYWIVKKGLTLSSEFGRKILGSRKYKEVLTSRNVNTFEKIFKAMSN